MGRIFISYRRDDARAHPGRLHDELAQRFGTQQVSSDVDSIPHGDTFSDGIADIVSQADAVLVVIGSNWLDSRNVGGVRRLDDPDDLVRREIAAGLQRNVPVIPVLVGRDDAGGGGSAG
jgi:hypothetical protein